MAKNVARTHSSASAFKTALVVGHGPSSNVSTTSLSRKKSCCLKCSEPKPGPPAVSTSTTRATPRASGFLQLKFGGAADGLASADARTESVGAAKAAGRRDRLDEEEIDCEPAAPVTSSGSARLDGAAVTAGCWTIRVRPSVKPITITEPTTALAAARTVVLRITMFPVSEAVSMHYATVIRKNWLTFG